MNPLSPTFKSWARQIWPPNNFVESFSRKITETCQIRPFDLVCKSPENSKSRQLTNLLYQGRIQVIKPSRFSVFAPSDWVCKTRQLHSTWNIPNDKCNKKIKIKSHPDTQLGSLLDRFAYFFPIQVRMISLSMSPWQKAFFLYCVLKPLRMHLSLVTTNPWQTNVRLLVQLANYYNIQRHTHTHKKDTFRSRSWNGDDERSYRKGSL